MSMGETIAGHGPLIARHAGSLLWLARYMERIENLARLLDVTKTYAHNGRDERTWLAILRINGDELGFFVDHAIADAGSIARFYLLDGGNPSSVQSAIRFARENARTLRALISTEMWLQINVFHGQIAALTEVDLASDRLSQVCAILKEGTQAHTGITEGTFYRDQGWHFYMLGRHIERADQTTRLLDTRFNAMAPEGVTAEASCADSEIDASNWMTLLRAAAGYHAYRREHPHGYRAEEVTGFLLKNGAFPRSVWLNLSQVEWHLSQLRSRYHLRGVARPMERTDHLLAMLASQTVREIMARGLSPFLDWMQREIASLQADISLELCGG